MLVIFLQALVRSTWYVLLRARPLIFQHFQHPNSYPDFSGQIRCFLICLNFIWLNKASSQTASTKRTKWCPPFSTTVSPDESSKKRR